MIFVADSGEKFGYKDGWTEDGFLYAGEGQSGDMTFIRGNRAIRDHAGDGKQLHLFEYVRMGHVRYFSEMVYRTHRIIQAPDINGALRDGIVFVLDIVSGSQPAPIDPRAP